MKIVRLRGPKLKKRSVTAIRHVVAFVARNQQNSIRKLAAEYKPICTINAGEKCREKARIPLLRLRKEDSSKIWIFSHTRKSLPLVLK